MWLNFEVSYTDHKQIIGRSGSSINRIMRNTKSHIHLPDLNISSNSVRINEATVYGPPVNIECARAEVRQCMNVTYCLEVDMKQLDIDLIPTAKYFSGPIEIFHHNKCLKVRGQTKYQKELLKAVKFVLRWLKQNKYAVKSTYLRLEVTDVHRPWVCGEDDANLKLIMQETGTEIQYHKRGDPPYRHQMTFTVYGDVEPIFYAREKLIGSLPVTLMFNVSSSKAHSQQDFTSDPEVLISSRRRKVGSNTFYIRSRERNIASVYRAMQNFVDTPTEVVCRVPPQYQVSAGPGADGRSPPLLFVCREDEVKSHSPGSSEGSDVCSSLNDPDVAWPPEGPLKSGEFSALRMSPPDVVPSGCSLVPASPALTGCTIPRDPWLDDYSLTPIRRHGGGVDPFQTASDRCPPECQGGARRSPTCSVCPNCNYCYYLPCREVGFGSGDFPSLNCPPRPYSGLPAHPENIWAHNMDKGVDTDKDSFPTLDYSPGLGLDFVLICRFLRNLNLEKYIGKFLSNDIDFSTLLTLTEDDLHSIGVTTFGAKRKLHIAIRALREELMARGELSSDPS